MADATTYRAGEFAKLASVTVRALRHYDRLGLLKPRRNKAGYRVYTQDDLAALEQILALKFIGIPLRDIAVIRQVTPGLTTALLGAQRAALEIKRVLLDQAIRVLDDADVLLRRQGADTAGINRRVIEVVRTGRAERGWMDTYLELAEKRRRHLLTFTAEARRAARQQMADLWADAKAALGEDPAGAKAQSLADRYVGILKVFSTKDDEKLAGHFRSRPPGVNVGAFLGSVAEVDRARIKATLEPFSDRRVWVFLRRALAVRTTLRAGRP